LSAPGDVGPFIVKRRNWRVNNPFYEPPFKTKDDYKEITILSSRIDTQLTPEQKEIILLSLKEFQHIFAQPGESLGKAEVLADTIILNDGCRNPFR